MKSLPFSLTGAAFSRPRFVLVTAVLACIVGFIALLDFPATEEPTVTLRVATVEAYLPGETADRLESSLARPIEEAIRGQSEVRLIETQIRPGSVLIYVFLHENVAAEVVPEIWQQVRARLADAQGELPAGTTGLRLNGDFGRVAVRTLALTGEGYTTGQLEIWAKHIRNQLQSVKGVATVSLHGVRRDIAYIDLDPARLRDAGIGVANVTRALASRDQRLLTGEISQGGMSIAVQSGDHPIRVSELASFPISTGNGSTVLLGSIATIRQTPQDPPQGGAFFNGQPSVVLGISMLNGLNVISFSEGLDEKLNEVRSSLPAGLEVSAITNQAEVVSDELQKVGKVFLETVVVVLGVVVLFLGWRSGLVTGAIVPMTVLVTLLIMQAIGIELHQISIAAIIIALGIFVDNGIVVVEDYERRVAEGEPRFEAARMAGETMFVPLLVSSLAIIFAFIPLVAGQTETGEYMRSLAIVLAITLIVSLVLGVTVIPLLAPRFIKKTHGHESEGAIMSRINRGYHWIVTKIVVWPWLVVTTMVTLLVIAGVVSQSIPPELFPFSQRKQIQVPIEFSPGIGTAQTMQTAQRLSQTLADKNEFPQVTSHVVYVADGGPRFILGLNPPKPAPNRAYAVVNIADHADPDALVAQIKSSLKEHFPEGKFDPKRFSLGATEAGTAVFRLEGADRTALQNAAQKLSEQLHQIAGMARVDTNMEAPQLRLSISVDQQRVAAAGLSNNEVFEAVNGAQSGVYATTIREGNSNIPVFVRGDQGDRLSIDRLASLPVGGSKAGIPLGAVATIDLSHQQSVVSRRDLLPTIEVSARHETMNASALMAAAQPILAELHLPPGHKVAFGGEIEENQKTNAGLYGYAPLALIAMFLLFLWQFGSTRKALIVIASMPFVLIGGTLGVLISGEPMSYTATIGFLALMGIIVNNAVLMLDRIAEERRSGRELLDAVGHAAEVRLRPILMTKMVCIAGLIPLFMFGGPLWRPMAAVMMGGLALGTLITLFLIPALYALAFRRKSDDYHAPQN
ncbi:efflux RND transporter permease subunit [Agrobacterium genomosp. 3]|jgi:multidrug efflux pump subunit AcrB|uniref:Efflux RND transporter permease subunit n=2 Tax=Hyphomicrobiales TaxID=356 RepID=A0AA50CJC8_9HYPH|nr:MULTISPECIES: efflux RND transporter permease subunit [Hyphomicrobiales]KRA03905.1 hypothetical protein ASD74_23255 [Rhizobium sp. Root564]MBX8800156.1 efflux RND transporter permease subunit [Ochrobactrum sp. MR28]MBX8815768.1 efflux RND transporter permease subunit [Ochrobactrum sp. MR31]MCA1865746.1 efflux RND transporter permease subunit [Agrobacterium tomkonis]MCA1876098.1 efflux RND transporter permease subunit [Agrobacterium tumefaciens]